MKGGDIVRHKLDPNGALKADWRRFDAMTEDERKTASFEDPDAQPLTEAQLAQFRRVAQVKSLRHRLGMTQAEFAAAFHLPISTLRDWEQHRTTPDAPARALLLAIERDPHALRRLLADANP
jgi:putative transcriptional regulator